MPLAAFCAARGELLLCASFGGQRPPDRMVSAEHCRACELWRDTPHLTFRQPPQVPNVLTWAVGVTTAPRKVPTLEPTLRSLAAAGWDRPRLFAEPGTEIPVDFAHLPRTLRDEPLGAFANWYISLAELVMRHPRAEAYVMVQDDVRFARNIRPFLEFALWPAPNCGCVSIYCPSNYAVGRAPGFHIEDRGWLTWTAQVLIFPNPAARLLVGSSLPVSHRHHGPRKGSRNIDCLVGAWCKNAGRPFYVFTPSLAEHIGETSTLYRHATVSGHRASSTFVGESADISLQLARKLGVQRDHMSSSTFTTLANYCGDAPAVEPA